MGVRRLFERGLFLHPERICLQDADHRRTYREVQARTARVARQLHALGHRRGDRCAVLAANSVLAMEATLAIYQADGVYVPLNYSNHVQDNIAFVQDTGASTLFYGVAAADKARLVAAQCPGVVRFVCVDGDDELGPSFEDLAATMNDAPAIEPVAARPQDVIGIHGTGGTTGKSKGVMLTRLVWDTMAANFFAALPVARPPVYLAVPPITHAAGTFACVLMAEGATTIVHPRFDAGAVLAAIEAHRVTHLYLPPTAVYSLLAHPDLGKYDYSSLTTFIYTSAPMSVPRLKECLDAFGPVMVQFWGQTEAPIFCTILKPEDHVVDDARVHRLASCGRPMLSTPVAVMDDHGRLLPPGERGEMVVRGNLVMAGYYNNPQATEEASRFGWHHTGDVGYFDDDGYFYLVDRKKEMIITGGFNVYPAEVEKILWEHEAVQECAVIGVPDDKWGESVKAIVQLKAGHRADDDALIDFCKSRLGSVKSPKTVEFRDGLPRNPVGKVDRRLIREPYWAGREKQI